MKVTVSSKINNNTKLILFISLCVLIYGCFITENNKKIQITAEYIINGHWNHNGVNSIRIDRMRIKKDSLISAFTNPSRPSLLRTLEEDHTFIYYANIYFNIDENYQNKKIYFGKDNGFTWLNDYTGSRTHILGNLMPNSWYKFTDLADNPEYVFVYIDSANVAHQFNLDASNW